MIRKLITLILLTGCTQSTNFLEQSEEKCSELVAILEKADSLDNLLKVENDLRKKFNEIAVIMVKSRRYHEKHPHQEVVRPIPCSGALLDELKRIYAIKGGRDVIERAQSDAQLW